MSKEVKLRSATAALSVKERISGPSAPASGALDGAGVGDGSGAVSGPGETVTSGAGAGEGLVRGVGAETGAGAGETQTYSAPPGKYRATSGTASAANDQTAAASTVGTVHFRSMERLPSACNPMGGRGRI